MFLSKTCIYAIRAVLYVAAQSEKNYVPINTISKELGISFHFLTKILQTLTQKDIMNSYRGPKGGIILARPATSVMLTEIVEAIDGSNIFNDCLLGLPGCGTRKPCPLHEDWMVIRTQIHRLLNETSVDDLAKKVRNNGLRLSEVDKLLP